MGVLNPTGVDLATGQERSLQPGDTLANADGSNPTLAGNVRADGTVPFTAAQSMGGFKLTTLATPTASTDASTKGYVDAAVLAVPAPSPNPFGGDGSLGTVTVAANTSLSGARNYVNFTINPGVTITVGSLRGLYVRCTGNFTNNGTISTTGAGYAGGTGGNAGGPGIAGQGGASAGTMTGGGNGGGGSALASGGAGSSGLFGGAGSSAPQWLQDMFPYGFVGPGGGGGGGGSENGGSGGIGGSGAGPLAIDARGNLVEGTITASGGGGGTGTAGFGGNAAGGGGGGGSAVLIRYGGTLTMGTVTVNGGAAGPETGAGSGASPTAGGAGFVLRQKVVV